MALVLADRVLETTTSTGSGTITLAGAEPGYQSFAVVGNTNQTYYTIAGDTEWEVGIGTYTSSGTTLSRDTVLSSSDSGNKVTFSAGTKKVFVTYPSEKSVNRDVSGNISVSSAIITNVAEPIVGSDAATKLYVDTLAAQGISYHEPVKYEVPNTTGNLVATYNNGTAGVSATLTNAGSLVPFVPDGVTASISDRVLVYNQTNAYENGVYVVSTVGNGSTAWVLTRAADADTYGVKSPTELGGGDAFFVTSGNTGAGETYVCNNPSVIIFGSTAITFAQISSAQVYQAGNGISLTNTTISLATPVTVANGGTGLSTAPTNGQLLIGNGSNYTLSTLTAGSGVSITNSAGSITLSATNSGAVTSVTATGPLASSGGQTPDISIANSTGTGSVVLDQGATISSATITAAVSASITTITGTSANITTVTGTTAGFSSANITQLGTTSATIATLSGTNVTYSSGTVSQLAATSATIASVSGTNVTYSNGNFTSATITTVSGTTATYTSATVTNLAVTSVTISSLSLTNLAAASATITTGNLTFSSTAQRITGDFSNATPSSRLAFQSSTTNGNTNIEILPNGTATRCDLLLNNSSDPANSSLAQMFISSTEMRILSNIRGTGTYQPMTFYTGGSERVRIDTSGNVGIGTASPGAKLDIAASVPEMRLSASGGATGQLLADGSSFYVGPTGAHSLRLQTNGNTRVLVDSSGNVGIGMTPSTDTLLEVYGSAAATCYKNTNTGTGLSDGFYVGCGKSSSTDAYVYNRESAPIIFGTANTERMRIDSSGNVGIGGTAQAAVKLEIAGTLPTSSNAGRGIYIGGTIPSGTTSNYIAAASVPSTAASSFTLSELHHFYAIQGTIGSGSAVTNQYGFHAQSSLTGATNNYGFFSNIASGSNRWNFYAAGTARNYFAGGVEDANGNLRKIPQSGSAKTTSYTLATTDVGLFIEVGSGGSITVPNSTFAAGDVVSIFNNTTGNVTLTMSITTAYIGGTDSDKATITLATRGVATILFISGTVCVVNGNVS